MRARVGQVPAQRSSRRKAGHASYRQFAASSRRARLWDNIGVVSNSLRDAPPSIWPALRRPDGDGKLVYLDQKHWVHLAQADTGHPDGTCYAAALQAARAARAAGTVFFPLSMVHYSETSTATPRGSRSRWISVP